MTKIFYTYIFLLVFCVNSLFAQDLEFWNLPVNLSDSNTTINFEVDSTWVLVEGTTSGIKGSVSKAKDQPNTIATDLSFLVENMKTGLSARDTKLLRIMAADKYPSVELHLTGQSGDCTPKTLETQESCILKQKGSLTIRGVTREIDINCIVAKAKDGHAYTANGEITFPWEAFGVEDPSILVAKLKPDVRIIYQVSIPKKDTP